jgi:formate dehydrogenase maturation protein FdhE
MTITVAANNARIRYTATSSQTAFAIPFEFFENDEIHVYVAATALVSAAERGQGTGSTEYVYRSNCFCNWNYSRSHCYHCQRHTY